MNPKILIVEDDECFVETIRLVVKPLGARIVWAKDARAGYQQLSGEAVFDLVILDHHLPDLKGAELAEIIRRKNKSQQIVFATGDLSQETLTLLLKSGASVSFIAKSDSPAIMLKEIERGIEAHRKSARVLTKDTDTSQIERDLAGAGFIGRSKAMHEILQKIQIVKGVEVDVLVLGETGVGKELVVRAMLRPGQKIFPVNCAAFSESSALLESELFGHAKGAFTDARSDKPGLVEVAEGGIIFLDEIHALGKTAQGKLLRFLQEKKFRRVGENFERSLAGKIRIVCATKPSIKEMVDREEFLPDLYYRIARAQILVPPLRDRMEDLEPLVLYFTDFYGKRFGRRRLIESSVLREMEKCKWPGNVRDLENAVASLVLNTEQELVRASDFIPAVAAPSVPLSSEDSVPLDLARKAFERQKILGALRSSRSVTEAAKKLNLARTTLSSRIGALGISAELHLATAK